MSDRGHIIIRRDIFDEPMVRRDPLCFYAWTWLLAEAAWKDRDQEVSNGRAKTVIHLKRGQLTHSYQYMANAWGVTVKRVRTILNRLETGSWIGTQTGTLQTVITICNYDNLQEFKDDRGTQTGTQTGTQRARKGHRTNHLTLKPEEKGIAIKQPERKPEDFTDRDWQDRLKMLEQDGSWSSYWGPKPGEPNSLVPARLFMTPVTRTSSPR
jgi:hypothetical protein